MKALCIECDRKRDVYRPVVKLVGGAIRWACRQCWKEWRYCWTETTDNGLFDVGPMYSTPTPEDQALMRKACTR